MYISAIDYLSFHGVLALVDKISSAGILFCIYTNLHTYISCISIKNTSKQ